MSVVFYYIVLPFIYLLSALPFRALYTLSNGMYVFLYHIMGYRKKVVITNLKNSFPEKTEEEINTICKQYYSYLCDLFLETFKTLTISKKSMLKHCYFHPDAQKLFDRLADENKSVILVLGHLGNWEWAGNTFSLCCRHQLCVIYHPLRNKQFDGLMYKMRSHFGTKLIAKKDTFRTMLAQKGELNVTAFIADQTPFPENAYWVRFLNQDTPVFKGTEIIAKKINYPVVYVNVDRIKRGYYELNAEMLCEDPAATADEEITLMHTRRLEQDIIARPETWLWSHKRWKHKRVTN